MNDRALPDGWRWAKLADVAEVVKKPRGYRPDRPMPFVPMSAISEHGAPVVTFETREPARLTNAYFEDGDLLLARITPCFENGKHGIVREVPGGSGFATTEVYVFRSTEELSVEYLALLLRFPTLRAEMRARMEGATGRMRVPLEAVLELVAPIPPVHEQELIVQEVRENARRRELAEQQIRSARDLAGDLRAAVLAELTRGGWPRKQVGEVGEVFVGATPSRGDPSFWGGDVPWVSSGEVAFGRISRTRENITQKGLGVRARRLHPPGTVLLAMIGEGKTRGQAAILDVHAAHNQNSAAIRLDPNVMLPEFLYFCFMQQYDANRKFGRGGQQPALNKTLVQALEVPCPQMEEQWQLAERIAGALAVIDAAEGDLRSAAILTGSFEIAVLRDALYGGFTVPAHTNGLAA